MRGIDIDADLFSKLLKAGWIEQAWVLTEKGEIGLTRYLEQVLKRDHSKKSDAK